MTEITYDPKHYKVTFIGHANYRAYGLDIVCASASMLFHTLCENLRLEEEKGNLKTESVTEAGNLRIQAFEIKDKEKIQTIFETLMNGARILAESYPEYVNYVKKEK